MNTYGMPETVVIGCFQGLLESMVKKVLSGTS